ncbi:putative amino acid permease/transporter [Trypanosoma conorhini]|uniref:Putative amino acid permease/transporter n=1 Tax=Trypanosoma conorhini TaxID=83891 RepID=A0A3R7P6G5_9TRYP|nr:putative amino acid permease/transporter [Trypanosoma conorhini]RNF13512.1 putative amino acid permease/transporter [Trypanosoma conorhini]
MLERQYFEHPRCHILRRNHGNTGPVAGPPSSVPQTGEAVSEQGTGFMSDEKKAIPKRSVSALMLLGIMYTYTTSGAYAIEETVLGGGPLLTLVAVTLIPILMAVPTAAVVAELAASVPSNAAYLMWINISFHRVVYFTMVILSLLLMFIDNALYPVLFSDYVCAAVTCTTVTNRALRAGMLFLTYVLNILGIQAVGMTSIMLTVITIIPFLVMFTMFLANNAFYLNWPAISYVPSTIDWPTFITTASWNLCGLEQAASVSEEVKAPDRTIVRALFPLLGLAFLTYIPPILTGASVKKGPPLLSEWTTGYWSVVAEKIGGSPLQVFLVIGSGFSAFGLMLSSLCTTTQTIAGVAFTEVFPGPVNRILYRRNERFGTYHWTTTINALITGLFSVFFDFGPLVKTDQVLYGIRVVLIFLSFFIIRYRYPHLSRPFRLPLEGYKLGVLLIPTLLFVALTVVATMEDVQTVIINISVVAGTILLSFIYCYLIRKGEFYGRVVTEAVDEREDD